MRVNLDETIMQSRTMARVCKVMNRLLSKTIVFGAGCFWSVEKKFQETYGVINVESGYADGKNIKPIYKEIIKREKQYDT